MERTTNNNNNNNNNNKNTNTTNNNNLSKYLSFVSGQSEPHRAQVIR